MRKWKGYCHKTGDKIPVYDSSLPGASGPRVVGYEWEELGCGDIEGEGEFNYTCPKCGQHSDGVMLKSYFGYKRGDAKARIERVVNELRAKGIHPTEPKIQVALGRSEWSFLSGAERKWFRYFVPKYDRVTAKRMATAADHSALQYAEWGEDYLKEPEDEDGWSKRTWTIERGLDPDEEYLKLMRMAVDARKSAKQIREEPCTERCCA